MFAGDVFHTPSAQKWNKLLDDLTKLVIATGNHELSNGNYGGNVKFDYQQKLSKISFHSSFPVKYPFLVNEGLSGTLLVMLLDTNNPNGLAEALNRVKKLDLSEHEGLVIISHHVTDPDMAGYAHSIPEHFLQPDALQQRDNFLDLLEKL